MGTNKLIKKVKEKVYKPDLNIVKDIRNNVRVQKAVNSCGIGEIQGVTNCFNDRLYRRDRKVVLASFKHYFMKSNRGYAYKTVSLTQHADKDLIALLDSIAKVQTDWKTNPNSKNKIKLWIL